MGNRAERPWEPGNAVTLLVQSSPCPQKPIPCSILLFIQTTSQGEMQVDCNLQHRRRQLRVPDPKLFATVGSSKFFLQQPQTQYRTLLKLLRGRVFRFGMEFLCREETRLTHSLFSPRARLVRQIALSGIGLF